MMANDPPETSAPGHTSQTSFHVPPSIFTKGAITQAADCRERQDRRADGPPRDWGRVGEQIQDGRLEGPEAEADHHGPGDGDRGPETRGPFDYGAEEERDEQDL